GAPAARLRGVHHVVEAGEELVATRVDLVAVGARHGLAQEPPQVREHRLPLVAALAREARPARDVGEEERDGAAGEGAHAPKCRSAPSKNRITVRSYACGSCSSPRVWAA